MRKFLRMSIFSSSILDLNLMDWGQNNVIAIALTQTLYLWNAETGDIAVSF